MWDTWKIHIRVRQKRLIAPGANSKLYFNVFSFCAVLCVSQPRKIQRLMKQTTKVDILEHKNINQKYSGAKLKCEIYENYWIKLNK